MEKLLGDSVHQQVSLGVTEGEVGAASLLPDGLISFYEQKTGCSEIKIFLLFGPVGLEHRGLTFWQRVSKSEGF